MELYVTFPPGFEQAFALSRTKIEIPSSPLPPAAGQVSVTALDKAQERANMVWKLANGSFLLPALVALFTLCYCEKVLRDVWGTQNECA